MKTVIVEIRKNKAAALTDDGCIIKVKNNDYTIGDTVYLEKKQTKKSKSIFFASCAAAVLIFIGVTFWLYLTPYAYVSLDINPSIEYRINVFNMVLSDEPVNDDGAEIVKSINVKNMAINDAIKTTLNEIEKNGYFLGENPGGIIIATSSKDEGQAKKLAEELKNTVKKETEKQDIPVESISVELQKVKEARTLGTTPGKLNLVKEMQNCLDEPSDIDFDEWLNKPVQDIMREIKKNKEIDEADVPKNKKSIDKNALIHKKSLLSDKKILNDKKQKFSNQQTANKHRRIKKSNKKYKNNKAKLNFSNKEVSKKNIDKNKKRPRSHQKESKAIKKQQEKILKRE
jgi:hypothetical protein